MKVSELIITLQKLQQEHGDLDVVTVDREWGDHVNVGKGEVVDAIKPVFPFGEPKLVEEFVPRKVIQL